MAYAEVDKKRKAQDTSAKQAEDQWFRYTRARDNGHSDYLKVAKKCNDFYLGEQWDEADRAKLEKEGRPALTINMVMSTVNAVLGEQTSKRSEFKYKPRAEGQEHTPGIMTKLSSAIKDSNDYDWVESQVFADGIIQERGFFDIRVQFNDNMLGEITIRSDDPTQIILDPDAKEYDPSTWKEVFETRWMSLEDIESTYGKDKRTKLEDLGINASRIDPDSLHWEEDRFGDTQESNAIGNSPASDEEHRTIKSVRVIERQHVRLEPCKKFVDLLTGDMKTVPPTWSLERADAFATEHGLAVVPQTDKKIRWTVTADRCVLHDDWSPYTTFTKVPFFPYFRRGKPVGLVTNLISPQEQLNKLESQELHIINTTANSGWIVERGSLVGMTADDLRNQGAETGIVLETTPGRQPPEKIQPNKIPTGIDRAAMKSASFIKEISGVNDAALGSDSPEVSGVALDNKVLRAQVQMQVPFDNLQRTRFIVAEKLLELVQQFYTEQRVFKVATEGMDFERLDGKDQEYVINQQEASGEILNDITVGKYEISLATVPARDSYDDMQFAEALNLAQVGVPIPPDRIVEYSHLARKEELAQEIRDMTGRGEPTEAELRIAQLQQMAEERMLLAQVAEAEAQVEKIYAEIAKLDAEASQEEGGMNSPKIQIQRESLDNKLAIARENVQLRIALAQLQSRDKYNQQVVSTQGKLVTDAQNNDAKIKQERIRQLGSLAQSQLSQNSNPTTTQER